jgi:hypothetical protein
MSRSCSLALVLLLALLQPAGAVASGRFDLIYTDRVECTFLPDQIGFSLGPFGFAIIVNTGTTSLTDSDLRWAQFTSTPSVLGFRLSPMVANLPDHAPILSHEAVGSVTSYNALLQGLLQPGEAFRNTTPDYVLNISFSKALSVTYAGPVSFDLTMTMGQQTARFRVVVNLQYVQYGEPHGLSVPSVARVSSSTGATPTEPLTWGRLKALYH